MERIESADGGVDVLINNAGFGMYGAMEDTELDDARYQLEVNLFGLARLTQLVLPRMREKGAGTIVNVSSMGGRIYMPLGSWTGCSTASSRAGRNGSRPSPHSISRTCP